MNHQCTNHLILFLLFHSSLISFITSVLHVPYWQIVVANKDLFLRGWKISALGARRLVELNCAHYWVARKSEHEPFYEQHESRVVKQFGTKTSPGPGPAPGREVASFIPDIFCPSFTNIFTALNTFSCFDWRTGEPLIRFLWELNNNVVN